MANAHPTRWVVAVTALIVIVIDQFTKWWAVERLENRPPVEVIGEFLQLQFVRNSGAAFSLGANSTLFISLLALALVAVLLWKAKDLQSAWWGIAMGLMLGGAFGNLIDRMFRTPGYLRGHVVDFLALPNWPVFNVADMAVVGAAILMVILAVLGVDFDGTRTSKREAGSVDSAS